MTLPTNRTTANTPTEHVADHNTVHGFYNTHPTDAAAHSGTYVALTTADTITAAKTFTPADAGTAIKIKSGTATVGDWVVDDSNRENTLNLFPPADGRRTKISYWSAPEGTASIQRPLSMEIHGRNDPLHAAQNHVSFYTEDNTPGNYHHVLHWTWGVDFDGLVYVGGASQGGDGEMTGLVIPKYEGQFGVGTITPTPTVAGRPVIQIDGSNSSGLTAEIKNTVASVQARWRTNTTNSAIGTDSAHDMLLFARGGSNTLLTLSTGTITVADAKDIVVGSTTGTKIGSATSQKLGFFGATPVVQEAGSNDVLASMVTLGLRAASSNPPLNLGSGALTAGAATLAATTVTTLGTGGTVTLADGNNVAVGSSSGTKIATATTQKLGFFNATPVVQPATMDVVKSLSDLGLMPASQVDPDYLTTGEATMMRRWVSVTNASLGASGTVRFTYFTARKTETITQMRLISGGTAAGATPTLVRAGIYSIDGSGNLTLVASIANDTAIFATGSTAYTRSLSGGNFSKVAGTRYAVGVIVVTGAALPTMTGANGLIATEAGTAPRLSATLGGQTDLPSSVTVGSLGDTGNLVYSVLLP